jgi:hypothetical protein
MDVSINWLKAHKRKGGSFMKTMGLFSRSAVLALAACMLTIAPSLYADGGANHQVVSANYGVSGGNINDTTRRFCCSGTLGSLVQSGTNQYILSNNHVLARGDQAAAGEDVSQPGLIDNGCQVPRIVADFTTAPALGSNVDAAIAQLRSGTMNTTGSIEDIGTLAAWLRLRRSGCRWQKVAAQRVLPPVP